MHEKLKAQIKSIFIFNNFAKQKIELNELAPLSF